MRHRWAEWAIATITLSDKIRHFSLVSLVHKITCKQLTNNIHLLVILPIITSGEILARTLLQPGLSRLTISKIHFNRYCNENTIVITMPTSVHVVTDAFGSTTGG